MIPYLSALLLVAWLPRLAWLPVLLLLLLPLMRRRRWQRPLFIFVAASLYAALWGGWQLSHRLPDAYVRSDVGMQLQIDSLVSRQGRRQSFTVAVIAVDDTSGPIARLRRLKLSYYDTSTRLQAGDRLHAVVRLFPPRGLSNPHAFDSERRYLSEGIDARGYIRTLRTRESSRFSLAAVRQTLGDHIDAVYSPTAAATLRALTLGDRAGLSDGQWRLLSETGTAHLMVVSGLHVALIAAIGVLLARGLCLPLLYLGVSALTVRRAAILLALGFATAYALLAGMGLPVQRALIMVAVFLGGEWLLRPISAWQRWRVALVLVTLWQPLAVVEAGAWLSFGAVALLIWMTGIKRSGTRMAGDWWRLQAQLFVGMLPLTALLFQQIGLLAPLVNCIALPLASLFVSLLPLLLPVSVMMGLPWLTATISQGIDGFWRGLSWARDELGLYLALPEPSWVAVATSVLAIAWWLTPFPLRWRWLSVVLLFPLLTTAVRLPAEGSFRARVFDVGQGLAVLVETAHSTLLYDTGPGYNGGGSVFPYAIAPLLRAQNRARIDQVVISHADSDHSGGLEALRQRIEIGTLISGQPDMFEELAARDCADAAPLRIDGVSIQLLQAAGVRGDNERSCVVVVEGRYCTLLLPGDLGFPGEQALSQSVLPEVDWLLAGHHGSATASSEQWLQRLQPKQVIFSRGRFNRFGHPATEVLERVDAIEAQVRDTAQEGALLLEDRPGCPATGQREVKRRYWTAG